MTSVFQIALPGFADEIDAGSERHATDCGRPAIPVTSCVPAPAQSDTAQTSNGWHTRALPDFANYWERADLLTFRQAARILGISQREFQRMADRDTIRIVRVCDWLPRVRPGEVQRFIDGGGLKRLAEPTINVRGR